MLLVVALSGYWMYRQCIFSADVQNTKVSHITAMSKDGFEKEFTRVDSK
jgi:hypothetical protein